MTFISIFYAVSCLLFILGMVEKDCKGRRISETRVHAEPGTLGWGATDVVVYLINNVYLTT